MPNKTLEKPKMGRPKKFEEESDFERLRALMRLNPTLKDTAAFFQCGTTTIEDTIKAHFGITFREFREQNMVHTRLELVRSAIKKAEKSDIMHKYCLANLCKWGEKQTTVLEGNEDKPIAVKQVDLRDRLKQIKGDTDNGNSDTD